MRSIIMVRRPHSGRLRTMLRFAGRTMKAELSPVAILRDAWLTQAPQDEAEVDTARGPSVWRDS
jgi:hypothetical protein